MKWQIRFVKNALFGILPLYAQELLRSVKRKCYPYPIKFDLTTFNQGLKQIELIRSAGFSTNGKDYLELGTGWYPIIPLLFSLAGCKTITLVDGQRLMDENTFSQTCRQMIQYKYEISTKLDIDEYTVECRLNKLSHMPFTDALSELNCNYLAPYDLLSTTIADKSYDIITSRAVLEHIPPVVIKNIFMKFNKLLRTSGVMCHIIDNSDHWEHEDQSISRINFLRYSDIVCGIMSSMNKLDYQNRLRHSDYLKLFSEAGFKILDDISCPDIKTLQSLSDMKLHDKYRNYEHSDLAILTSILVVAI